MKATVLDAPLTEWALNAKISTLAFQSAKVLSYAKVVLLPLNLVLIAIYVCLLLKVPDCIYHVAISGCGSPNKPDRGYGTYGKSPTTDLIMLNTTPVILMLICGSTIIREALFPDTLDVPVN